MLTPAQEQFFVLLRAALWNKAIAPAELGNVIDWKEIYITSRKQTVTGLIADAIQFLPEEQRPPKPILQRFIKDKLAIGYNHVELNSVLNEVVKALNAHQIPHVLLKGQGVAQNYPNPTSRSCGDIDLYVGKENHEKACEVIRNIPGTIEGVKSDHDIEFTVNKVTLELHYKADVIEPARIDRKFTAWTREKLDRNFGHPAHQNIWDNNGTAIVCPEPIFDAVFILSHMFRHMVNGGVGLRQLTDWTMYLHRHHQEVDKEELQQILEDTNLTKIWEGFGAAAVRYLGLKKEELILPVQLDAKLAEKVMKQIFISGNFGHAGKKKKASSKYYLKKFYDFTFRFKRMCILWPMFPKCISIRFSGWFTEGIARLFRHE